MWDVVGMVDCKLLTIQEGSWEICRVSSADYFESWYDDDWTHDISVVGARAAFSEVFDICTSLEVTDYGIVDRHGRDPDELWRRVRQLIEVNLG